MNSFENLPEELRLQKNFIAENLWATEEGTLYARKLFLFPKEFSQTKGAPMGNPLCFFFERIIYIMANLESILRKKKSFPSGSGGMLMMF